MMKTVAILFFNTVALYILGIFVFGHGGMVDNLKKDRALRTLEVQKMQQEIELESMKKQLSELEKLDATAPEVLILQGKKHEGMKLFRFTGTDSTRTTQERLEVKPLLLNRIYLSLGIVILMIITGNGLMIFSWIRRPG